MTCMRKHKKIVTTKRSAHTTLTGPGNRDNMTYSQWGVTRAKNMAITKRSSGMRTGEHANTVKI